MKKKYKDYADYLKSDKWKQVKEDYAENNNMNIVLYVNQTKTFNIIILIILKIGMRTHT